MLAAAASCKSDSTQITGWWLFHYPVTTQEPIHLLDDFFDCMPHCYKLITAYNKRQVMIFQINV